MRLALIFATLLLTAALPPAALTQPTPSTEIAPTGRLRVAMQTGSPIIATRGSDGKVSGVVVDLAKFIAERLDLQFEPIVYVNQETYAESFGKGEWGIAIGVRSPLSEDRSGTGSGLYGG